MVSTQQKSFLVTGASSGIGKATSIHLATKGAVTLVGRDQKRLEETYRECQKISAFTHSYKVLDLTQVNAHAALVENELVFSGVVHSAGISELVPLRNLTPQILDKLFSINTFAPLFITIALLRHRRLVSGSSVVFLSSVASKEPEMATGPYSMSKAALEMGISNLALEYSAKTGVRFNAIRPSYVQTPLFEKQNVVLGEERLREIKSKFPLGLSGPEDIVPIIDFLISDASAKITGSFFRVDGGRSCRPD